MKNYSNQKKTVIFVCVSMKKNGSECKNNTKVLTVVGNEHGEGELPSGPCLLCPAY